jgi:hypothetical protein
MAEPGFKIEAAGSFRDGEGGANTSSTRRKGLRPQRRPEPEAGRTQPNASEVPEETDEHTLDTVA